MTLSFLLKFIIISVDVSLKTVVLNSLRIFILVFNYFVIVVIFTQNMLYLCFYLMTRELPEGFLVCFFMFERYLPPGVADRLKYAKRRVVFSTLNCPKWFCLYIKYIKYLNPLLELELTLTFIVSGLRSVLRDPNLKPSPLNDVSIQVYFIKYSTMHVLN